MRRRALLAAAALALPAAGGAQEAGRRYRVAGLFQSPRGAAHDALVIELGRAGFVEAQNLTFAAMYSVPPQGLEAAATELVKAQPDAIVAGGDAAALALLRATQTIPVVAISDDLVRAGLAASLANPQTNVTGVSILASELNGKRQEILLDLMPGMTHLAALADPASALPHSMQALHDAAKARGVALSVLEAAKSSDIGPAIEAARARGAQALNVLASAIFHANRGELIARIAAARLPAMYQWPEYVDEGALIGYGPRLEPMFRHHLARVLVRVLKGARPAEVPIEQPTSFELGINLQTARTLGLTVPQSLLSIADQLVE